MAVREAAGRVSADDTLTDLYAAEWTETVRLAYLLLPEGERDRARAEDVAQAAFVAAYPRLTALRRSGTARAYLRRSVVDGCRSAARRRTLQVDVAEAHDELTPRQREVVVLRYYADLPGHQIADAIGISAASVSSQADGALDALRTAWGPQHGELVQERLREVLRQEADAVRPGDRLDEIRTVIRSRRPWVRPLVATAAVLALAVGVWLAARPTPPPFDVPYKMLSPNEPMTVSVLPVYYVVPLVPGSDRFALVREQRPFWLPYDASPTDKADLALAAALQPPSPNANGSVASWLPATTSRVVAHSSVEIDVEVSQAGMTGLPDRVQELAVQALVWTVTEVLGEPNAPVRMGLPSGGSLFATKPSNVYTRPGDRVDEELAPISVDAPYSGQRLTPTAEVVLTGTACTVEGDIAWELSRDDAVVARGNTTASSGCPQRGSWSVDLAPLPPGDYRFRAFAVDAQTGGLAARTIVPFSVG